MFRDSSRVKDSWCTKVGLHGGGETCETISLSFKNISGI